MGQALYRKYRSKKLAEIVGQEHVTTALQNALDNGTVSHAYLFTGPRGTGKTSIARILAHEVNKLTYDEGTTHLDIIEIDAASNRRIDEIRTLRERVHNAPSSAKYKVYIIDEVHMLTKEAFNALLKTLEEPPAHVIFILATTEVHKLPETIISRTQRYSFKPADVTETVAHLANIAKTENIDITSEALELVAIHGRGSFRDSISLLDQVSNLSGHIDAAAVRELLGLASEDALHKLITILESGDSNELLAALHEFYQQGQQPTQIAKQLTGAIRSRLLNHELALTSDQAIGLLERLLEVPASHDPTARLELLLLEITLSRQATPEPKQSKPVPNTEVSESPKAAPSPPKTQKETSPTPPTKTSTASKKQPNTPATTTDKTQAVGALDETAWQQVLQALKQQHNTLYGVARMAVPIFDEGTLTLAFSFPFHQKRFNDPKNKQVLSDIIAQELQLRVTINCVLDPNSSTDNVSRPKQKTSVSSTPPEHLDTITSIFGGGEVLE